MANEYHGEDTPDGVPAALGKAAWNTYGSDIGRLSKKLNDSHAFHILKESSKPLEFVDKGLESLSELRLAPGPRKMSNFVGRNVRSLARTTQPVLERILKPIGIAENVLDMHKAFQEKNYANAAASMAKIGLSLSKNPVTIIPSLMVDDMVYTFSGEKPANNEHGEAVDDPDGLNELFMTSDRLNQIRKNGGARETSQLVQDFNRAATSVGNGIVQAATPVVNEAMRKAASFGGGVMRAASAVDEGLNRAASAIEYGKRVAPLVGDGIVRAASPVVKRAFQRASSAAADAMRTASSVGEGVMRTTASVENGVKRAATAVGNDVIRRASSIGDGISKAASYYAPSDFSADGNGFYIPQAEK